jgi:hypothetical protein
MTGAVFYQSDAFSKLHRIVGQHNLNSTFKVIQYRNLPTLLLETIFDIIIIYYFQLGKLNISSQSVDPTTGDPLVEKSQFLVMSTIIACHTVVIFIKFPLLHKVNLLIIACSIAVFIISLFFSDPDLIGF